MTAITDTPFAKLDAEDRLLKPILKGTRMSKAVSAFAVTSRTTIPKPS